MQNAPLRLHDYEKRVLSQFGQDGMIETILQQVGAHNRYFVEFGSNGREDGMGNTAYLRRNGWRGLLMDLSANPQGQQQDRDYDVKIERVRADNINELFVKYDVPGVFDLLSIDIDGQDFHVWNALDDRRFRPRIVVIESASHIEPPLDLVQKYDPYYEWDGKGNSGASPAAMAILGKEKGYTLVGMTGADMLFVDTDVLMATGVSFVDQDDLRTLYAMTSKAWRDSLSKFVPGNKIWKSSQTELNRQYGRYRAYFEVRGLIRRIVAPPKRLATWIQYKFLALERRLGKRV